MTKIIEVKDLTWIKQGRTILNIPHFDVEAEESISMMGPNGAGKSSLLFIMAGLQEPSTGTVSLFGKNIKEFSPLELHRRIGVVFQKPMMLDLTVMENLELGLRFRGMKPKARAEKIEPWLERMRLTHLIKRRARSLSGGEAQRVSLAQALVVEPEIVFLDEPFANLDKEIRQEIMHEIKKILTLHKITTVMVTHHRLEAIKMTGSICYMEDGEILKREYVNKLRA
jgi:tungstate transport system ATP-binding protein